MTEIYGLQCGLNSDERCPGCEENKKVTGTHRWEQRTREEKKFFGFRVERREEWICKECEIFGGEVSFEPCVSLNCREMIMRRALD